MKIKYRSTIIMVIVAFACICSSMMATFASETDPAQTEETYQKAVSLMYSGEFKDAENLFNQIRDYRDSSDDLAYIEDRLANGGPLEDIRERFCRETDMGDGTFYECIWFVYYIPHHIDENTKSVLYYPGGCGEMGLFTQAVRDYVTEYKPNAIIVCMRTSGYGDTKTITSHVEKSYGLLESICREQGCAIHDLVIAGSSNGGYTGLKAIPIIYEKYHVRSKALLVFDMGVTFTCSHLLPTADECKIISDLGSKLYFYEQADVNRNNPQLQYLESIGLDPDAYTLVYCTHDEHNRITWEGFSSGSLSWALGEQDSIPSELYTFESRS